jgi:hypothetical protein
MTRVTLAGLVFLGVSVAPLFAQQTCQAAAHRRSERVSNNQLIASPLRPHF